MCIVFRLACQPYIQSLEIEDSNDEYVCSNPQILKASVKYILRLNDRPSESSHQLEYDCV